MLSVCDRGLVSLLSERVGNASDQTFLLQDEKDDVVARGTCVQVCPPLAVVKSSVFGGSEVEPSAQPTSVETKSSCAKFVIPAAIAGVIFAQCAPLSLVR